METENENMDDDISLAKVICLEYKANSAFVICEKDKNTQINTCFDQMEPNEVYIRRGILTLAYLLFRDLKTVRDKSNKASEIIQDIISKFVIPKDENTP